jgi:CheY-like chemotaxis protein
MASPLREYALRVAVVVETDPSTANSLAELLCEEGFHVLIMEESPAVSEVRRLRPDLVVVGIPVVGSEIEPTLIHSGTDHTLINALKDDPFTCAIPIMTLSEGLRDIRRNESTLRSFVRAFVIHPWVAEPVPEMAVMSVGGF